MHTDTIIPAPVAVRIPEIVSDDAVIKSYLPYLGTADFDVRNAALRALCNRAGLRLPETIVPEGDSLLPIGEDKQRKLACEVAQLPDLTAGLAALRARIAAEKHVDSTVPVQRIRAEPTRCGIYGLGQDPGKALGYTDKGFSQLLDFVRPANLRGSPAPTLLTLSPRLRAEAINEYAERVVATPDGSPRVLRSFLDPLSGRRVIRAVTSDSHSLETGDDVAVIAAIESALPAGAKLRVTRTFDRTDFEIIWPALDRQLVAGDVALIALSIANSETKAGSIRVSPKLLRVLCKNFTTAYTDGAEQDIAIRHVGDLRARLPGAIIRALAVVEPFVRAFGDAYKVELPAFAPTRGEILGRVVQVYELPRGLAESAAELWDADGAASAGNTLAGLVNALTRASQEQTLAKAAETEQAAGRLIHEGWAALEH